MEVRIGVQHAARELSIDSSRGREDILTTYRQALSDGDLFTLSDETDRTVAVRADRISYLEFSGESGRTVGFGA